MMLVAPEHRGRGIGRQLFSAALDHLRAPGTSAVKLDATPAGRSLYEVFGFVRESVIERWETVAHHTLVNCESNDACEIRKKIHALDQSVFGADRTRLLDTLIIDSIVTPQAITTAGGKLQGYALARCGLAASYVGPIIAQDESTALELLDRMIGQLRGQKVYLDFHPGCGATTEALLKRGFLKQRELVRMRYCRAVTAPTSPLVFAIAGPETG